MYGHGHGPGNGLAARGLAPCDRRLVRARPGAGGSRCGARAVAIRARWTDEFASAERAAPRRPAAGYWRALLALRSAELGEPVTFRVAAERQFLERLIGAGVPAGAAALLIAREWAILAAEDDQSTGTFQQITGRPRARRPSSFTSTDRRLDAALTALRKARFGQTAEQAALQQLADELDNIA
jgi:hypothetical protein